MRHTMPLPRGWAATELGRIRVDLSRTLDPRQYPDEDFELYSVPSFADGEPEIVRGSAIGSTKMTLTPGTVVVCKINPRINRVWVVGDRSPHKKIGSGEWIPFFPVDGVTSSFLAYYLQRDHFRNFLAARVSGVGGSLMRVRPTTLDEYPLPVPSVSEQQRIVEAIESYLTRLDNAVALLERVEQNLKRYRASVLKAAVEGRLVPTEAALARQEGREYEPASELLTRILAERKTRWMEGAAEKARAKAAEKACAAGGPWSAAENAASLEKEGAKAATQYKEPAAPDTTDLPDLPEGWCWASAGQLGVVTGGVTKNPGRRELGLQLPYLRVANVYADELRLADVERIGVTEEELPRVLLEPADLLVVEGNGSAEQIGRVALWSGEIAPCVHQNHIIKVRLVRKKLARYALEWLLSIGGRDGITRVASSTSGLYTLSISKVESLPIPLCPEAEAVRIVETADRLLSIVRQESESAGLCRLRAVRLRQSILKWAFEGKLAEQDPNDEQASVLLERLRAERVAACADKPRARKRRSAE